MVRGGVRENKERRRRREVRKKSAANRASLHGETAEEREISIQQPSPIPELTSNLNVEFAQENLRKGREGSKARPAGHQNAIV